MEKETWKNISIREKLQLINGTGLIVAAITLYFLSFIITLSIGFDIISAGATLLATGLALFGITGFVKNSMMQFETKIEKKLRRFEDIEEDRKYGQN
jgi:hypothetical protein